jgi:hypothetical protein
MPNFPRLIGHNYLGPGNPLDAGEPIDSADRVAKIHDEDYGIIEYLQHSASEHFSAVQEADNKAVDNFLKAYSEDNNLWNLVGAAGLNAKAAVEGAIGSIIYPKRMGGTPERRGHKRTNEELLETPRRVVERPHRRLGVTPAPETESSGRVKVIGNRFQKGNLKRAELRLAELEQLPRSAINDKKRMEQVEKVEKLRNEMSQWQRVLHQDREIGDLLQSEQSEIGDDPMGGAGPSQVQAPPEERMDENDAAEMFEPEPNVVVSPTVNEIVLSGPETDMFEPDLLSLGLIGEEAEMAGVSQVLRSNEPVVSGNTVTFSGSRLLYSWGYNFGVQDLEDNNDTATPKTVKQKWLQTPMAYIPVDWVPFYMAPGEYDDLPKQSRIKKVSCKVIPWGSRTSFTTASETSKPATAQHIVTGISGIGLNNEMSWTNRDVTNIDSMVVAASANTNYTTLVKKFWGSKNDFTEIPTCFGAIRGLDTYGGPVVDPQVTSPAADSHGFCFLDRYVNRFDMAYQKGKPCINYEYEPRDGMLKHKNPALQVHRTANGNKIMGSDLQPTSFKSEVNFAKDTTNAQLTQAGIAIDAIIADSSLQYNSCVEKSVAKVNYSMHHPKPQPQLHVGILPVFANTPTSSGIICAAAYWQVDYECVVEMNFGTFVPLANLTRPSIDADRYYISAYLSSSLPLDGSVNGYIPTKQLYA